MALPRDHSLFKNPLSFASSNHVKEIWGDMIVHELQEVEVIYDEKNFPIATY